MLTPSHIQAVTTGGNYIDSSLIISIFALIISIATFIWRLYDAKIKYDENIKHKNSILIHEHWTQAIVVPHCLEPLREFIFSTIKQLRKFDTPADTTDIRDFLNENNDTLREIGRSWLATSAVDQNASTAIQQQLDSIQDNISDYLGGTFKQNEQQRKIALQNSIQEMHKVFIKIIQTVIDLEKTLCSIVRQ